MGFLDWLVGNADKELEMITALTYVAVSDGKIEQEEGKVIDRFCANIGFTGISKSTIQKGIEKARQGELPDFSSFTDSEKRDLLKACGKVAEADGTIEDSEFELVMGLARLMGYSAEQACKLLDK